MRRVNVPVTLVLSTPLTWTMMRAARGPLADAVLHYLTAGNLLALVAPVVLAVALPLMLRRRRPAAAAVGGRAAASRSSRSVRSR